MSFLTPLSKLITLFVFLITVVSFGKYDLSGLLPLSFYIFAVAALYGIPLVRLVKRIALALPFVLFVGIFNPLLDTAPMPLFDGLIMRGGWVSFITLAVKGILTVSGGLLLGMTTGAEEISVALRRMHVPRTVVEVFSFVYRYIHVLSEEIYATTTAYALRSGQKGIAFKHWGRLTGQLFIRAYERANRIYTAMHCRGYTGELPDIPAPASATFGTAANKTAEAVYILCWAAFFAAVRLINIPAFVTGLLIV